MAAGADWLPSGSYQRALPHAPAIRLSHVESAVLQVDVHSAVSCSEVRKYEIPEISYLPNVASTESQVTSWLMTAMQVSVMLELVGSVTLASWTWARHVVHRGSNENIKVLSEAISGKVFTSEAGYKSTSPRCEGVIKSGRQMFFGLQGLAPVWMYNFNYLPAIVCVAQIPI